MAQHHVDVAESTVDGVELAIAVEISECGKRIGIGEGGVWLQIGRHIGGDRGEASISVGLQEVELRHSAAENVCAEAENVVTAVAVDVDDRLIGV